MNKLSSFCERLESCKFPNRSRLRGLQTYKYLQNILEASTETEKKPSYQAVNSKISELQQKLEKVKLQTNKKMFDLEEHNNKLRRENMMLKERIRLAQNEKAMLAEKIEDVMDDKQILENKIDLKKKYEKFV